MDPAWLRFDGRLEGERAMTILAEPPVAPPITGIEIPKELYWFSLRLFPWLGSIIQSLRFHWRASRRPREEGRLARINMAKLIGSRPENLSI
jgi:hypothetical protein